jgi:hypothetical protein
LFEADTLPASTFLNGISAESFFRRWKNNLKEGHFRPFQGASHRRFQMKATVLRLLFCSVLFSFFAVFEIWRIEMLKGDPF